jgi:hypothetical protein
VYDSLIAAMDAFLRIVRREGSTIIDVEDAFIDDADIFETNDNRISVLKKLTAQSRILFIKKYFESTKAASLQPLFFPILIEL